MKWTTNEIREKYLKHFEKYEHIIIPSSRLVPENDPTTLFTGSGMQPMIQYLLGAKHPQGTRITDSQKCFRSQDIEEVGDNRHTTFFEMLGNWSLGDYFKEEQIEWMWEFLVEELKLDPKKLFITCFKGAPEINIPKDVDASQWWQSHFRNVGIEAKIGENPEVDGMKDGERIFYYPARKNWWSRAGIPQNMPVGEPGGPDSEMFFDFEAEKPESEKVMHRNSTYKNDPCHPNCDCGRFMEIGNNVFMEYIKTENGFEQLKNKNIDFGGGLERMTAAVNDNADMFLIDVFEKPISLLQTISRSSYEKNPTSFRVILDHMRSATFLISDGILPGNKDQNYYVRRLLRRAIRFGRNLGITENFCANVALSYIEVYRNHYKELLENKDKILQEIDDEENKFNVTLKNGESAFAKATADKKELSGAEAFLLYESYGFPYELIEELAKEKGIKIDKTGYEEARLKHQDLSRAGSEQKFKGGLADNSEIVVKYHTATHLLHRALKDVLGEETNQKGSNITPERLRFDFSHNAKMSKEEIKKVEDKVNEWIQEKIPVSQEELPKDEALKRGAVHLFGEKYGDIVSVYTIGDKDKPISIEFCGGPHVKNTSEIGKFKIQKEESISAGVRRIKAVVE